MDVYSEYYVRKRYDLEFKLQVCREHIETGSSLRSLSIKYNLSGHSLIHEWLRRFNFISDDSKRQKSFNLDCRQNEHKMDNSRSRKQPDSFTQLQLEKRIEELEKQLKEAEMKSIAFSTMIDI